MIANMVDQVVTQIRKVKAAVDQTGEQVVTMLQREIRPFQWPVTKGKPARIFSLPDVIVGSTLPYVVNPLCYNATKRRGLIDLANSNTAATMAVVVLTIAKRTIAHGVFPNLGGQRLTTSDLASSTFARTAR